MKDLHPVAGGCIVGLAQYLLASIVWAFVWLHVLETRNLKDMSDEITIRYQKIPAYRG